MDRRVHRQEHTRDGTKVKRARAGGLRLGAERVAERLADAVNALDFVLKARDDRTDVRERTADVFHVPLVRGDAVETELMGLVRDQRPVNQAVDGSERGAPRYQAGSAPFQPSATRSATSSATASHSGESARPPPRRRRASLPRSGMTRTRISFLPSTGCQSSRSPGLIPIFRPTSAGMVTVFSRVTFVVMLQLWSRQSN